MDADELPARLGRHITALTGEGPRHGSNPAAVRTTLDYLTTTVEYLGLPVSTVAYGPDPHNINVIVDLPGTDPDAPVLEIGAHWDSVAASPGADDNASGVAGLLEIARALTDVPLRRRVRLCFFGGEESSEQFPDGRAGSRAHVQAIDAADDSGRSGTDDGGTGVDTEGAIVLEMIGYTDSAPGSQSLPEGMPDDVAARAAGVPGVFIAVVGNTAATDYVDALTTAAAGLEPALPVLPVLVADDDAADVARSDHSRYWDSGRKGVMLTDTANFRNPHYHASTDTLPTLDLDFAAQVTSAVVRTVRTLAG